MEMELPVGDLHLKAHDELEETSRHLLTWTGQQRNVTVAQDRSLQLFIENDDESKRVKNATILKLLHRDNLQFLTLDTLTHFLDCFIIFNFICIGYFSIKSVKIKHIL